MPNPTKKKPSIALSKGPKRVRKLRPELYQMVVRFSQEDNCFLAYAPALQGCVTHGETAEEALRHGREAIALWIADAHKHGVAVPEPRPQLSGKLTLRMPVSLHQQIHEQAEREGVSINQWIITQLAAKSA